MKIIIIDTLGEKGHINYNYHIASCLSEEHEVSIVTRKQNSQKLNFANLTFLPENWFTRHAPFRLQQIYYILHAKKIMNKNQFDTVLYLAYETISFSITHFAIGLNTNVSVINHNNVDQILTSKIKEFFFKFINIGVTQIILLDYIGHFLVENYSKKTLLIPHPTYFEESKLSPNREVSKIFSPTNNTNPKVISQLITFCEANNCKLVAKGPAFSNKNIQIISYFNDYKEQILASDIVFISSKFKYRISGIAFDSLSLGRPIVGFKCMFFSNLKKLYPSLVHIVDDIENIKGIKLDKVIMAKEFQSFHKNHSNDQLSKSLKNLPGLQKHD